MMFASPCLRSVSSTWRIIRCQTQWSNSVQRLLVRSSHGIGDRSQKKPSDEFAENKGNTNNSNANGFKYRNHVIIGIMASTVTAYYAFKWLTPDKKDVIPEKPKLVVKPPIKDLPEVVPFLIVGGGTASFAALRAIRSHDSKAKVLVVSDEAHYPYMRPPLSKELWFTDADLAKTLTFKTWSGRERSLYFEHSEFYCPLKDLMTKETGGVSIIRGSRVVKIDANKQRAYLDNGQIVEYEKCLIATGGRPKNLPVLENASNEVKSRVILFRKVEDFVKVDEISKKAKSVTIVGGGFLGSELACALGRRSTTTKSKLQVNQIYPESGNMAKILPEYLSKWTTNQVRAEGVNIIPESQISSATMENNEISLQLTNGSKIRTDYVIVAVGLEPNTELADTSDLEIDELRGGYVVNTELEARTNLWVAGDASCFYDPKLGRRRVEHHDHAVVSGRLAGENMVGSKRPYWHQSMFWSDLGPNVGYEAIGIVDSSLPTVGVFATATEEDTPKSRIEETDGSTRPVSEPNLAAPKSDGNEPNATKSADNYGKGIIFYLRDKIVVGIVLWNVFNKVSLARRIINEGKKHDDLNEVAKLFNIHSDE